MKKYIGYLFFCLVITGLSCGRDNVTNKVVVTHGPILGRLSHNGIGIWVRTSQPAEFSVICKSESNGEKNSAKGQTSLEHDNTGWVHITGLKPNSKYAYEVEIPNSGYHMEGGTFLTLPHEDQFRIPELNPRGLFNFSFEFGCGNMQNETHPIGTTVRAYKTMLDQLKGEIHFQIMNGDWLYEEVRETPPEKWMKDNNVPFNPDSPFKFRG